MNESCFRELHLLQSKLVNVIIILLVVCCFQASHTCSSSGELWVLLVQPDMRSPLLYDLLPSAD